METYINSSPEAKDHCAQQGVQGACQGLWSKGMYNIDLIYSPFYDT